MNISRNKILSVLAIFLLISMSALVLTSTPTAKAAVYQTHLFGLFSPNPCGVGERIGVIILTDKPVVGATDKYHDYTVTITDPNGNMVPPVDDNARALNVTLDVPIIYDPTASAYTFFTPTMVGTYKAFFNHNTETMSGNTYLGNNWTENLIVTETPTPAAINSFPLPSEYWARPIEDQNSFWFTISSNWMNSVKDRNFQGVMNSRVQDDGIAPNTPHVMWSAPIAPGVDASQLVGDTANLALYNSPPFTNVMIMNGNLYYAEPNQQSATSAIGPNYRIVDLRTGEVKLIDTAVVAPGPQFGGYSDVDSENQHGVSPSDGSMFADNGTQANYNTRARAIGFQNGTQWIAYRVGHPDGINGNVLNQFATLNDVPSFGAPFIGIDGALMYAYPFNDNNSTNPNNWYVRIWNSSKCISGGTTTGIVNASGTTATNRLQLNVPLINEGRAQIAISNTTVAVAASFTYSDYTYTPYSNAILLCRAGDLPTQGGNTTSGTYTYFAISLANQTIQGKTYFEGQLMWSKDYNYPSNGSPLVQGPSALGVFTLVNPATGEWYGYDVTSGTLLWGPVATGYPYTPSTAVTGSTASIAAIPYTLGDGSRANHYYLYITNANGALFALDLFDGSVAWHQAYAVGQVAGYNNYPLNIGAISDGKIYVGSFVPAGQRIAGGNMIRALNATDGTTIWSMPGWGGPGGYAISDGYMVFMNYYDAKVYSVGRGPSAITIDPITSGSTSGITVTGTITDQSPGSAIKGTGCVSDASMAGWMASKFMGQMAPLDAKGVPIVISVVDPNGNTYDVATVTSNTDGSFSATFVPPVKGTYQIVATFAGTNGYYPSFAHSTAYAAQAEQTAAPTATPTGAQTNTMLLTSTAAIIIALVIAAIVLALILRRH